MELQVLTESLVLAESLVLVEQRARQFRFPVVAGPARFRGSSRAAAGGPQLEGSCLAEWEIQSHHHREAARAGEELAVLADCLGD